MPRSLFPTLGLLWAMVSSASPAFGQTQDDFERPSWAAGLPIEAQVRIGGHVFKAVVAEKAVPDAGPARAAYAEECWLGDMIVLSVFRDGRAWHQEEICSAYALSWMRFYDDGQGSGYLFLGYAEGRGTHATASWMRVYALGQTAAPEADVLLAMPMTPLGSVIYGYRATPAPAGGLLVDLKAIEWPEDEPCCEDMAKSHQITIPPAH